MSDSATNLVESTSRFPAADVVKAMDRPSRGVIRSSMPGSMEASSSTLHEDSTSSNNVSRAFIAYPSHLPTPQTTASVLPYFPGIAGSPVSPLAYAHGRALGGGHASPLASRTTNRSITPPAEQAKSFNSLPQTATPDASPPQPRPQRRPSSAPLLSSPLDHIMMKVEPIPPPLTSVHVVTPPRVASKQGSPPPRHAPSDLSSPFVKKTKANNLEPGSGTVFRPEIVTPQPLHSTQVVELLSPARIETQQPEPGSDNSRSSYAEVGSRPPGGELERIRTQLTTLEMARQAELDKRRPDFLKRINRSDLIGQGNNAVDDAKETFGIAETPVQGRRLQLFDFQYTSEESFEESLMTHGYTPYGEPRTPQRPITAADARTREAMDWLVYNTPIASATTPHIGVNEDLSEKELKKRKRLEAFVGSAARAHAKLYPAEVEGYGRVLINVPPEEADSLFNSPSKKRTSAKRRRIASVEKRGRFSASSKLTMNGAGPQWLDDEFPWSLREKERIEELDKRNTDRLERICHYLSRDTDSEDDADKKEEALPLPTSPLHDKPEETVRKGRGKAVPLQTNPERPAQVRSRGVVGVSGNLNQYYPSDPADARTALMSKRAVRLLAYRRAQKRSASDSTGSKGLCFCGMAGDEDEKTQVQCDECYTWYHTDCLGIKDIRELGGDDEPYFCYFCRPELHASASNSSYLRATGPQREPTFVPTEERPIAGMNDLAFFSSSSPLSTTLQTPTRGPFQGFSVGLARRSLWDDRGLTSPLGGRPAVRVLTPRTVYSEYATEHGVFNPFESPTRMVGGDGGDPQKENSNYAFTTPKAAGGGGVASHHSIFGSAGWPHANPHGGLLNTPVEGRAPFGYAYGYGQDDSGSGGLYAPPRAAAVTYAADDTPIRRAPPREARALLTAARVSELVAAPGESPVARTVAPTRKEADGAQKVPAL